MLSRGKHCDALLDDIPICQAEAVLLVRVVCVAHPLDVEHHEGLLLDTKPVRHIVSTPPARGHILNRLGDWVLAIRLDDLEIVDAVRAPLEVADHPSHAPEDIFHASGRIRVYGRRNNRDGGE